MEPCCHSIIDGVTSAAAAIRAQVTSSVGLDTEMGPGWGWEVVLGCRRGSGAGVLILELGSHTGAWGTSTGARVQIVVCSTRSCDPDTGAGVLSLYTENTGYWNCWATGAQGARSTGDWRDWEPESVDSGDTAGPGTMGALGTPGMWSIRALGTVGILEWYSPVQRPH